MDKSIYRSIAKKTNFFKKIQNILPLEKKQSPKLGNFNFKEIPKFSKLFDNKLIFKYPNCIYCHFQREYYPHKLQQ